MNLAPRVQGRALPLVLVCVVSFEFCHRLQGKPSKRLKGYLACVHNRVRLTALLIMHFSPKARASMSAGMLRLGALRAWAWAPAGGAYRNSAMCKQYCQDSQPVSLISLYNGGIQSLEAKKVLCSFHR